jgi:hypothetical protein
MDIDVEPDWHDPPASTAASGRGAGTVGFAGVARSTTADAGGLTTLAGGQFDGGPVAPMLPATWRDTETG